VIEVEHYPITRALDLQLAVLRCQRSGLLHGASDLERSVIATIVSELGSNVLKYAAPGSVEVRRLRRGLHAEVEIIARDTGPGIANLELALTEHYSSGRTLGLGLSGVRRMSDHFQIASSPGGGTTVMVRKRLTLTPIGSGGPNPPSIPLVLRGEGWSLAAAIRPRRGARLGGDQPFAVQHGHHLLIGMIDATGHGLAAHDLALQLATSLRDALVGGPTIPDPTALLVALHERCIGTPGAAVCVAHIELAHGRFTYLAVGNVRAAVLGRHPFRGVSRDGMLGRRWPTPFLQRSRLTAGDQLLIWTDGLPENLTRELDGGALRGADLAVVAERLIEAQAREHDDAGLLVLRWAS
jgi:anti-sigma regulatory factor (Ser/Thr protein kinase)